MTGRVALATACALMVSQVSALAQVDAARVRRMLRLAHGVEQEYREAFDASGVLVRPIELEEATMLLAEAREMARTFTADLPDVNRRVLALSQAIDGRGPVAVVTADCRELREAIVRATGVDEDVFPTEPPSASSGAVLYAQQCVSCHGVGGAGDGPDAARLKRPPPDFTDASFMRMETPTDFFLVISLGRQGGDMPAWEDALSLQERWDLVSYLWFLGTDARFVTAGQEPFLSRCAACHMPGAVAAGDGALADAGAVALNDLPTMAGRTDAAIDAVIRESPAHARMETSGATDRWQLVAFVRTLSLGLPADAAGVEAAPADQHERFSHALLRVEERLAEAVSAYRLRENDAGALAMDAYLTFEPLEPRIASRHPGAVGRVEAEFVRLHQAIRQPESLKEVEAAARAVMRALAAVKDDAQANTRGFWLPVLVIAAVFGVAVLGWRKI